MSPRPRKWLEDAEQVMSWYADGLSEREIVSRLGGVSRWAVHHVLRRADVELRGQFESYDLARRRRRDAAEVDLAALCVWPRCPAPHDTAGRLCATHRAVVVEHDGDGCAWPGCWDRRVWDGESRRWAPMCFGHAARVEGRLS